MLLFFQLDFSGCANLEDCNAAGQLGETLLQFFAVVIRISVFDFSLDLIDATLNVAIIATTFDQRGLVFGDDHLFGFTQKIKGCGFQLQANFFADDLTTGEDGNVLQHGLAALTKTRSLDSNRLEGATDLVNHQCGKSFSVNIFSDDHQRTTGLHDLFQDWQHVTDGRDLRRHQQDVRVFKNNFHPLRVSHEVGRDIALVETHSFNKIHFHTEGLAFFDGDHSVFADLVNGVRNHRADFSISS
ncbi:unannotated protein [freshwater metagenome]|uniref:Unannotated protein n=1 Tax=freshwater metagenome TaxID=449393 RepID=A0A6J7W0X2_9ZZZZ